jgi:hypothetical protein
MSKGNARQEAKPQTLKTNSPILIDSAVKKSLQDCVGLFNCSEQGKCSDYELCLKKYMKAEARNETLQFNF